MATPLDKKQDARSSQRSWLYALAAALFILTLALLVVYIPQATIAPSAAPGWKKMVPANLMPEQENGKAFGYYDQCGKDRDCRACKKNMECLACMNKCYNRHGAFYKKDNPRLSAAMLCNNSCSEEDTVRQQKRKRLN